ncbi:MAG: CehA/McbA family metallohydrolase [Pseudomonadota bacterium]
MSRSSLLIFALIATGCAGERPPWARAYQIEDLSQGIGGVKAIAQPGDFLVENDRIRVAILGARNSMGPDLYGGSIVDVDLQRDDPRYSQGMGNDIFSEMFPTVNLNIMKADAEEGGVEIPAEHPYGEAAVVRVTAPAAGFLTMLDAMWALVGAPPFDIVTDYVLEPGASYLRIVTTVTYGGGEPQSQGEPIPAMTSQDPLLEYAIEDGIAVGDLYLSGGSVDVFAPGIGFDEDLAVQEATEAGQNLFLDPFEVDWLASTGDGTSYGYASREGPLYIPMFTSNQTAGITHGMRGDPEQGKKRFADGTALTSERILAVGEGDVGSVLDVVLEARGAARGHVEGRVLEQTSAEPVSGVHVFAYRGQGDDRERRPYAEWRTDVGRDVRPDGSFGGDLPVGRYTLLAHAKGHPDGQPVEVEIREGKQLSVSLDLPMAGHAEFEVVDEVGRPIPAKVTVFPAEGAASTRNPVLGDGYQAGGNVDQVYYSGAPVSVDLPVGSYYAVASRGPEYDLDTSPTFMVSDHDTARIQLQVARTVDTTGWIAADLHVHCESSFDAGTTMPARIRSMAAEGVEYFPATDHDFLTDYRPTLESLGLEEWVQVETGVEVSPMEMGHTIGFPQWDDYLLEAHGAFEWTGMEPQDIFDNLRASGPDALDPVVIVAHPHDGILGYFDQFGLNPYEDDDGDVKIDRPMLSLTNPLLAPDNFSLDFEVLEVFNSYRTELIRSPTQREASDWAAGHEISVFQWDQRTMEEQQALIDGDTTLAYGIKGQVDTWFTLLNLGYRHTAVGSSDSHYPSSTPSGQPRTWLACDTDNPAYVDTAAVLDALRGHRAVASYGPFVRFEADGQPIGSEIVASGDVEISIQVSSPAWFQVDHVELYENGTLIQEIPVQRAHAGGVNLDTTLTVSPSEDSWYVVIASGFDDLDPVYPTLTRKNLQVQDVVTEALASMPSLAALLSASPPRPRQGPMIPYALTNPIWVDVGGDGWEPPGLPDWLMEPEEPE